MTKQELAKKKGLKYTGESQTPAEAMITTKPVAESVPIEKDSKKEDEAPARKTVASGKKSIARKNTAPSKKKSSTSPKSQKTTAKKSSQSAPAKKAEEVVPVASEPVKNKGGRPKTRTEAVKIANIAIPESVYGEMSEYALAIYNGNMTEYINTLIRKDLQKNLKKYKEVVDVMKRAKGGK